MGEEIVPKEVFARKASGLVREAGLIDAFAFGFLNQGPAIAIWMLLSWGVSSSHPVTCLALSSSVSHSRYQAWL
jgi:hypothetical protein